MAAPCILGPVYLCFVVSPCFAEFPCILLSRHAAGCEVAHRALLETGYFATRRLFCLYITHDLGNLKDFPAAYFYSRAELPWIRLLPNYCLGNDVACRRKFWVILPKQMCMKRTRLVRTASFCGAKNSRPWEERCDQMVFSGARGCHVNSLWIPDESCEEWHCFSRFPLTFLMGRFFSFLSTPYKENLVPVPLQVVDTPRITVRLSRCGYFSASWERALFTPKTRRGGCNCRLLLFLFNLTGFY